MTTAENYQTRRQVSKAMSHGHLIAWRDTMSVNDKVRLTHFVALDGNAIVTDDYNRRVSLSTVEILETHETIIVWNVTGQLHGAQMLYVAELREYPVYGTSCLARYPIKYFRDETEAQRYTEDNYHLTKIQRIALICQ